jgi:hypothetical protein
MKKIFFLTTLLFSVIHLSFAQVLKTGLNFSDMTNELQYTKSKLLVRYQLGWEFKAQKLSEKLTLNPEFILSWQGQKYFYEETFDIGSNTRKLTTDYKDKLTYLQLPILLNASISDKLIVEFGPSGGLLLSARRAGETKAVTYDSTGATLSQNVFSEDVRYNDPVKFPDGSFRKNPVCRFDAALNLGVKYKLTNSFGIGLRYSYGLVDVFRNSYPFKGASSSREVNKYLQVSILYFINK